MKLFCGTIHAENRSFVNFREVCLSAIDENAARRVLLSHAIATYPVEEGYYNHKVSLTDISKVANGTMWDES